jgi:surfactin synthase thioesterase subunit
VTSSTKPVLLCAAPAGAGPSFFRTWQNAWLHVVPIALAGREARFGDDLALTWSDLRRDLERQLDDWAGADADIVVFGHSFGACVAVEAARIVEATGGRAAVVVSGSTPPGVGLHSPISDLPDDRFLAALEATIGYAHPALHDPELAELILPVVRADLRLHESSVAEPVLAGPLLVVRGTQDILVGPSDMAGWRAVTTGPVEFAELPGDHMYLIDTPDATLELVAKWHTRRAGTR